MRIVDLFKKKSVPESAGATDFELETLLSAAICNFAELLDNNCREVAILDAARQQISRVQQQIEERESARRASKGSK